MANADLTDNPDDAILKVGGKTTVSQKLSLLPLSTTRGVISSVPIMPKNKRKILLLHPLG